VNLRGYWKPFENGQGKTSFGFIAQFIEHAAARQRRCTTASPKDQIDAFG